MSSSFLGPNGEKLNWRDPSGKFQSSRDPSVKMASLTANYAADFGNGTIGNGASDYKDSNYTTLSSPELLAVADLVQETREKLDVKMQRINPTENSDASILFNVALYTSILWSLLAVCILYYIFTEI